MASWLVVGGGIVAAVLVVACTGKTVNQVNQPAPLIWSVDGKEIQVDRAYLDGPDGDLAFVIEWRCPECGRQTVMTREETLTASRPILLHAVTSGELVRLLADRFGTRAAVVKRTRVVMTYSLDGKPSQTMAILDRPEDLLEGIWAIDGRQYRVVGTGYYFDIDAQQLYFIMRWHDRSLCEALEGITDEKAAAMAMPLMKVIASKRLFTLVPVLAAPDKPLPAKPVERIGIEIGCPAPDCGARPDCPARGYRVARSVGELTTAP